MGKAKFGIKGELIKKSSDHAQEVRLVLLGGLPPCLPPPQDPSLCPLLLDNVEPAKATVCTGPGKNIHAYLISCISGDCQLLVENYLK